MNCETVFEGSLVGAVGGSLAGISISLLSWCYKKCCEYSDKNRVYKWLKREIEEGQEFKYRSTRAIASHNNITEDRARYICSIHSGIFLSMGDKPDHWGISGLSAR